MPPRSMAYEREIEADLVAQLYDYALYGIVVAGGVSAVYTLGTWTPERAQASLTWMALQAVAIAFGALTVFAYRRGAWPSPRQALRVRRIGAVVTGITWALGYPLLCGPDLTVATFAYLLCLVGLATGVSSSHAMDPPSALIFSGCVSIPITLATFESMPWMSVLQVLFVGSMGWLASVGRRRIVTALELRYRNQDLLQVALTGQREAERADASKTRFVAAASHDLRQPVQAISLFAHAVGQAEGTDERKHLLGRLGESAEVLSSMLERLLDLSRLDAGTHPEQPQHVNAKRLLEEVWDSLRSEAEAGDVAIQVRGRDAWVWADPTSLRRVLHNLASNAVRHGGPGGAVLLAVRKRPGGCEVQVWDEGPGIDPGAHESIFEEFVQLGNEERDRSKGLGLGLPMVRRMCEQAGWPIRLRSQVGRGSMFSVQVPHGEPQPASRHTPVPSANPNADPNTKTGHVLLVEDDAQVREAVGVLLEGLGWTVQAHADGDAAIGALSAQGARLPKLLISDHRLPGAMQGPDVIAAARRVCGETLPALLLTGEVQLPTANTPGSAGSAGLPSHTQLARKPVSAARLQALIDAAVCGTTP